MGRRLLQSAGVLVVVSVLAYGLMGLMPGDPLDLLLASTPNMTAADADRLRALYGLDRPLWERYLRWLAGVVRGDWGMSRLYAAPVIEVIGAPLLRTAWLMVGSLSLAVLVAVPLALWSALRPASLLNQVVGGLSFVCLSLPVFWVGLMAISLFAVRLGWLPAGGFGEPRHLILPIVTLSLAMVGQYTRYLRASLRETFAADHIRTAIAKGASPLRVVFRHALQGALLPLVTVVALDVGALLSGALICETVFAYPGMGKLTYEAVMGNDYPLALACLMLATVVTLAGNAAADGLYRWLDPRIGRPSARGGR